MKNLFFLGLTVIFSMNLSALNIDCEGKVFRDLESDKDTEVIKNPGGMMQTTYKVVWSDETVMIAEDMTSSMMPGAEIWHINRQDLSFKKVKMKFREDSIRTQGKCKIWEKPKENIF
tara:strand:+ start:856 stop:1206 length:351 start_codon:yes stop_codon:yes gene_type:complete